MTQNNPSQFQESRDQEEIDVVTTCAADSLAMMQREKQDDIVADQKEMPASVNLALRQEPVPMEDDAMEEDDDDSNPYEPSYSSIDTTNLQTMAAAAAAAEAEQLKLPRPSSATSASGTNTENASSNNNAGMSRSGRKVNKPKAFEPTMSGLGSSTGATTTTADTNGIFHFYFYFYF
jgi:hypothetical protein